MANFYSIWIYSILVFIIALWITGLTLVAIVYQNPDNSVLGSGPNIQMNFGLVRVFYLSHGSHLYLFTTAYPALTE